METFDPIGMHKGIIWEEAKGKLRALVAIEGSKYSSEEPRYTIVSGCIEAFIEDFESQGYHE